ncbi:MAG: serine hydrolase domain-containing protein [Limisphaerales bacterium]
MSVKIPFGTKLVPALILWVFSAIIVFSATNDPAQGLEVIRKKHDLPAIAVVVVKEGRICERIAVGVRKSGDLTPVTTNDVFHIGSCTKSMTATLTAMLIEDGKLRWDTTIAEVFPELKGKMDKQYETVTVEQLLHHRGRCSWRAASRRLERGMGRTWNAHAATS